MKLPLHILKSNSSFRKRTYRKNIFYVNCIMSSPSPSVNLTKHLLNYYEKEKKIKKKQRRYKKNFLILMKEKRMKGKKSHIQKTIL
jgi:hypothetical protein